MIYKVRTYGDPVLKKPAVDVEVVDDEIRKLLDDMIETMHDYNGAGLAGPQIGVSKRLFVIEFDNKIFKVINPKIKNIYGEDEIAEEGCLSVPEIYEKVKRKHNIEIEYLDENGEKQDRKIEGFLARVFQHEADHLDGILFVEKISRLAKHRIGNKLKKMKKNTEKELKKGN